MIMADGLPRQQRKRVTMNGHATFDPPPPNTTTPYYLYVVERTERYRLWATDIEAAEQLADETSYSDIDPDNHEIDVRYST